MLELEFSKGMQFRHKNQVMKKMYETDDIPDKHEFYGYVSIHFFMIFDVEYSF